MTRNKFRGQGLLEFALILLLLFLLLAGAVDLGRFLFTSAQLFDAAQEGVQVGSLCTTMFTIDQHARANSNFPIDLNSIDVVVEREIVDDLITVKVRYENFRYFLPFLESFFGNTISAEASARVISATSCP